MVRRRLTVIYNIEGSVSSQETKMYTCDKMTYVQIQIRMTYE